MADRKNIIYLSRIRAIACIAVVILHTFYACDAFAQTIVQHSTMLSVRNLMMWAVPCFVMVSGALLLERSRFVDFEKLFKQYILRMVLALVIFSLLFSIFDFAISGKPFGIAVITDGLKNAVFGTGWKHMWYLYMMIALYLLLPVYKIIARSAVKKDLIYLLVVYLVFLSIIPTIQSVTGKTSAFYICSYTIYPFYLFLGYALHNKVIKVNLPVSCLLVILSAVVIAVQTSLNCRNEIPEVTELLGNYSYPFFITGSIGVYALFQFKESRNFKILDKILLQIDRCSFGVYLIHMAVLKFIVVKMQYNPFQHGGFVAVLFMTIVIFVISFVITYMLKFIPAIKKLI